MANNNSIYNAAIAGASGGVASRWLTKQIAGLYNDVAAQIVIFASAIDALIPANPLLSERQVELMQNICSQVISSRWLRTGFNPANIAISVVALWTRMSAELLNETTIVVEQLNWDGTANATLTVLPANHKPGMYFVFGSFVIITPDAGIADRVTTWADAKTSVAQTNHLPAVISLGGGLSGEMTVPAADSPVTVFSDGLTPVVVQFQPGGAGAAFRANVYASAIFIGAVT